MIAAACLCRTGPPYDVAHVERIGGPWLAVTVCALVLGVTLVLGLRERHLERLKRRAWRNPPKHRTTRPTQPNRTER